MTVTVTTEPTYVLPGKACEITCSASAGNFVRMVLTSAPTASSWQKRLDDENLSEIQLWAADAGQKVTFTFDVPGTYVCSAREVTKGGRAFGGGYLDDPDGWPTETAIGSTAITFNVGQRMTAPMRIGRDTGTLVLYVWGSTIRETTVPDHGEKSPRIDGDTEKMKVAANSSAVQTALAALVNVACSTAASSLATVHDDIRTKWNLHIVRTTSSCHGAADTVNGIGTAYQTPESTGGLVESINHINGKVRAHFLNDSGTGIGYAAYHTKADWTDLPILTGASEALSATLALASLWDSYEAHRVNTAAHGSADSTNTLTALPALYSVFRNVITVLRSTNPTAPATDNAGATLLVHRSGMSKG